ncbi:MAG: TonB-dependent receptor [Gemmatimonadaceae bacterium]
MLASLILIAGTASAQDSAITKLKPVVVTVTRTQGADVLLSPFAVTVVTPDSTRPGQRHSAIDEMLSLVPGLSVTNRNNPSQDPRLAIRGFGARSAFGVRGVRVLRDGMPLTLPDGQTPLDYLSLESVGSIEILRGPASALYGNASGGVIDIKSQVPPATRLATEANQWAGDNGFSRSAVAAGGSIGQITYQADFGLNRTDGARLQAAQRAASGFLRTGLNAAGTNYALSILALDMPLAENPGALTEMQLRSSPDAADPLSVRKNARKVVRQIQTGVSATRAAGKGEIVAAAFVGARSLDNPLTFGVVEIGRHTGGASVRTTRNTIAFGWEHRLAAGFELQTQNDLRRNYVNCTDSVRPTLATPDCPNPTEERGVVTLDQRERVSSKGVYVSDEVAIGDRLRITAGVRADRVRFNIDDRLVTGANPDDSGIRTLGAFTPFIGVLSRLANTHSVYANVSSAFETPTATELGNRVDGSAGINRDLHPQRSTTMETGMKGEFASSLRYDLAGYTTFVSDELVPFEIPSSDGRRFFRNAGRTRRSGAEAGVSGGTKPVAFMASYSYSRFRFDQFGVGAQVFDGNEIPGTPRHRAQGALTISAGDAFAVVEAEAAGSSFLDDGNSARGPRYEVAHVRAGSRPLFGNPSLSFTIGAQNLFDRRYAPSVAVNAARGKYFEPAPGRSLYVGLAVKGRL